MNYKDIIVTKKEGVATITIDRPKVMNAIRHQTMLEIRDVLESDLARDEEVKVVVLTGSGDKAFISGGDISIMQKSSGYVETVYEVPTGQAICGEIENFRKPIIARINGLALGGGTEVALSCDIRIASSNAKFGLPEIKLGIIPGYGGTQRLTRLVGMGKAKELIFTGDHISAQEAYNIGMLNHVVEPGELDVKVDEISRKIAERGSFALYMAKTAINNGAQADLKTGIAMEAMCFGLVMGTEDKQEGMTAFLEKRKPSFKGK